MANYVRSHTAKKSLKETLLQNLCYCVFVCFAGLAQGRGRLTHPTSLINANKAVKNLSHFPRRYREALSNIFGKYLGLDEQI